MQLSEKDSDPHFKLFGPPKKNHRKQVLQLFTCMIRRLNMAETIS